MGSALRRDRSTRRSARRRTTRAFVAGSAALGLVVAGLALPATVAAGAGVRVAADSVASLPGALEDPALPQRSVLLAADGSPLATLFLYDRELARLDEISPLMQSAIIAVEDSRFYDHVGVDVRGTARALVNNSSGGDTQGGSTLTQQYVKNALILAADSEEEAAAAQAPTVDRKIREARLAIAVERESTKEEILEKYLNIAYFGDGAYGVQAAARHYFGVSAAELTLPQAATLAGVVRNPARDPKRDPEAAQSRRDLVLSRMLGTGAITQAEHDAAVASPLGLNPVALPNGCAASWAPFFCDWVRRVLESDPALGATQEERRARLLEGGLVIRTTLDPVAQRAAQEAVDSTIPRTHRVATAVVTVQPGTGHVTAMAVNRGFGTALGETEVPLPTSLAQPGSTFKIFTLAAALEQGVPLSTRLPGGSTYRSRVFSNPDVGYFSNSGSESGSNLDLRGATAHSVNTAFVQLQEMVGTQAVVDMAKRLGVTSNELDDVSPKLGSLTLGALGATPLDMASAYATIAGRGVACRPVGVTSISDASGEPSPVPAANCHQAVSPAVADTVASLMSSVVTEGTGRRADIGRPVAGKTGTTQLNRNAWFAGFTPDLASAVWVGDPRGAAQYPLVGVLGYRRVYGGDLPAIIFSKAMRGALENTPPTPLPTPDGNVGALAAGPRLPDVAGLPQDEAAARLAALGVVPVTAEVPAPAALLTPGSVVSTEPAAGSPLVAGQQVRLDVVAAPAAVTGTAPSGSAAEPGTAAAGPPGR